MTAAGERIRALLVDGRVVTIRPVGSDDEPALKAMHEQLTDRSNYLRFFTFGRTTAEEYVHRLVVEQGVPGHGALVAELDGRVVAVASYAAVADPAVAEVAFAVADRVQARGLGTLLLEHLVSLARSRGVRRFTAEVLSDNARMLRVFADAGLAVRTRSADGEIHVDIPLEPDDTYLDAVAGRERVADTASLRPLLRPAAVAVIGAGRRPGSVGHAVLRNILACDFSGPVYPVNPHADSILGVRAFASVTELPEAPDLAVVCVPAEQVPAAAEECGRRGVRALAVLSAGVTGDPDLEPALRRAVVEAGIRLVGPNCLGVASLAGEYELDATFARALPPPGPVGVVTQSGGVGIALLEQLSRIGLGISTFVSTGDKYDVSSNDLLMWWDRNLETRIAVLYLESFGNPRKFARIARRLGLRKPIVAVRSGTSDVARRAAASHTAAAATPVAVRDALFRQAGVVVADDLADLVAVVGVLAEQPLPAGNRVAVISNAGGAGVLAADACAAADLALPELGPETVETLAGLLPPTASLANPIDTTAGVSAETFLACLRAVVADGGVDGVVAISAPTALADLAPAVTRAARGAGKPLLGVRLDQGDGIDLVAIPEDPDEEPEPSGRAFRLPSFAEPAAAVRAYAKVVRYAAWRDAPAGRVPDLPGVDLDGARRVVAEALAHEPGGDWLDPAETAALLTAFGIPVVDSVEAADADAAVAAAAGWDGPVALKAVAPGLLHKSDRGGVLLSLTGADAVRTGFGELRERFGPELRGVLVQPMVPPGVETIVGVVSDETFGPLVVFGAGGVTTDLLGDRAFRLAPITDLDAAQMVRELRSAPLLAGYRGAPPADRAAVEDVLLRVGRLAESLPEVAELDLNPLVVHQSGCVAVDARVRLVPRSAVDPYLRRLR